jgi:hypothetical protein
MTKLMMEAVLMRKIKKTMATLISLLLLTGLTAGSLAAAEKWNYNEEEYLDVIALFWSVE